MRVAKSLLPQDPAQRHGFLRDYFCDKDALAVEDGQEVRLDLVWPSGADRHVDPVLDVGLSWWGRAVGLGSMWSARWRDGRIMTSLFDTWTLLSWSEWLARAPAGKTADVVILHVDDHRDLGSPRLLLREESLIDAITGLEVRLAEPDSIRHAIESGAIGMGSFMTPFVHEIPHVPVRHLCQPPKMVADINARLVVNRAGDTLLHPGAERLAISFDSGTVDDGGTYVGTNDVRTWTRDIEGRPALVHIDMDYFNNRYDGDSEWQLRELRLDPELPQMLSKVDELVDALAASKARIEDVAIAYSPGFFPAEHWQPLDERLRAGLARIL